MREIVVNRIGKARRVVENGREWLVAPATLIVPGVLPGSRGPLYYPPDEVERYTPDWNGMPITVNHPTDPISNRPQFATENGVWERQGIGEVRESAWNGKQIAQMWFDAELTRQKARKTYNKLINGEPIELSTGLQTDNEDSSGVCPRTGRSYYAIARNYRPDHVAVLPDQVGACSIRDGCGVLINAKDAGGHGSEKHSAAAEKASEKAHKQPTMGNISRAVSAHLKAASAHFDIGDHEKAAYHFDKAEEHRNSGHITPDELAAKDKERQKFIDERMSHNVKRPSKPQCPT